MAESLVINLAIQDASFTQQLKSATTEIKKLESEFKLAESGTKDFGKTTEGLTAKIKLNENVIVQLSKKLETYKQRQQEIKDTMDKASTGYEKQEQKVNDLKTALSDAEKQYGKSSTEVKELTKELKDAEKTFEQKRNAVINADNALKNIESTINKTESEVNQLNGEIGELNTELDNVDSKNIKELANDMIEADGKAMEFGANMVKVGQGVQRVGESVKQVGKEIVSSLGSMVEAGMEYDAQVNGTAFLMKGLSQSTQDLINSNSQNATAIGMTDKQYAESAVKLANYQKTMGFTTEEIDNMNASTIQMVADLGAVQDVPFEESMASYQSMLKGNYEAGDRLNISLSANTLANTDYIKSLGKSWNELSETEKMTGIYLETQRQASSASGLAAQEAGESGMQYKLLQVKVGELVGELGTKLLPILEPIITKISEVVTALGTWIENNPELTTAIMIIVGIIGGLLLMLGSLLVPIGGLIMVMGTLIPLIASAGGIMAFFSAAILPVIAVIGLIIGIVVVLFMAIKENWEGIKNATNQLIEACRPQFEALGQAFSGVWEMMKSIYATIIQPLFKMIGQVIEQCIVWVTPILQTLIPVFTSVFNFISSFWNGVGRPVFTAIIAIIQMLGAIVKPVMDVFVSVLVGAMKIVLTPIQWVIDKLSDLFNWLGSVGDKVGGVLSKLNPFKSMSANMDINQNINPVMTRSPIMPTGLDNIALSGSYYTPNTYASNNVGEFVRASNGLSSSMNSTPNTVSNSGITGIVEAFKVELNGIKNDSNKAIEELGRGLNAMATAMASMAQIFNLEDKLIIENAVTVESIYDPQKAVKAQAPYHDKTLNKYNTSRR